MILYARSRAGAHRFQNVSARRETGILVDAYSRRPAPLTGGFMIVLGLILIVLGYFLGISLLYTLGGILLVIGVVLLVLGSTGRAIGGRRHFY
jgi:hypothetical protein